ncbi:hypothetical protein Tco_1145772 [Tanacetum coccineum]
MDDPNITMEEYIRLEEEKAHRRGKVYKWETAMYGRIWCNEDVHDLRSVETEFPAIVFDNAFTSEVTHSCEPTVSPLNDNKIDFKISFDESDDEDYMVIYDKNSFSYKIISTNDLKTDSENDSEEVNMPLFPLPEPMLEIFTLQMGMYNSSQSSCDFTTVAINGESEERRTIEGIIWNYYDREDGETALRFEGITEGITRKIDYLLIRIENQRCKVLYKVEDIATCLVEYVKFWDD